MAKMLAKTRHFIGAKFSHCQTSQLRQKHVKRARAAEKIRWQVADDFWRNASDEAWTDQYDLPWSERT